MAILVFHSDKEGNYSTLLCPFCGGAEIKISKTKYYHYRKGAEAQEILYYVECTSRKCGGKTKEWKTKIEAVRAWNHREKPKPPRPTKKRKRRTK